MRCFHCMKELNTPAELCPHCGKAAAAENPIHQLAAGTVLNNRYLVGNSLGEGGFGITYLGYDQILDIRIAIKEYYPSGLANRVNTYSNSVAVSQSIPQQTFEHGKENFLREAKSIARFKKERSIVDVNDFFTDNNTAYIIIEYIDGITLMERIKNKGTFECDALIKSMVPLMRSLEKMHAQNIIHRDISPDNIMLEADGSLKLLDFGAARYFSDEGIKTMSVILKKGYAPYEQYSKRGNQSSWTDVYALCATIYKCITGVTPPDSLDRVVEDELKKPSALGVSISPQQEKALMRGLAVYPKDRIRNINELISALLTEGNNEKLNDTERTAEADPVDPNKTVAAVLVEEKKVIANKQIPVKKATPPEPKKTSNQNKPTPVTKQKKKHSKKPLLIGGIALVLIAALITGWIFVVNPLIEEQKLKEKFNSAEAQNLRDSLAQTVSASTSHTVGLKSDGTVVAVGTNSNGQCDVEDWKDIISVSAGSNYHGRTHTVGLKSDGTVVATGDDYFNQCDVGSWKYITAISCAGGHSVGLKSDGTVVATGNKGAGQCDVEDWEDIVAVSAGYYYTVGLKSDGTVVATGRNSDGQCDVENWNDIIAVSAGWDHTVGIKKDGTVVATGKKNLGQCDVSGWKDIAAVTAGWDHTVGLKNDGTVVATGKNSDGQCNVDDWKDIVAITAGINHTVGLKSDGTVAATGNNSDGQCNIRDWKDIKTPANK